MRELRRCTASRFLLLVCVWAMATVGQAAEPAESSQERTDTQDLYRMDIEQLLRIEIKSAAALTETDTRRAPVSMTELDARDVERSGVTDLNQLLETRVPNTQFIDHHHLQAHIGMRGIISDREDKYVYQVNGRTMNNRMLMGADNERAIPLLGDIRSVTVVRGPASATHGAGALAGVIGVQTYTGLDFQGFDLKVRQGIRDQYTAGEARFGRKLGDNSGVFLYYGVADQAGASNDAAPYYLGHSYAAKNGLPANVAGQASTLPLPNYNEPAFGELRHKAHASLVSGPFEIWARFVQDGHQDRPLREVYTTAKPAALSTADWLRGRQFQNRQFTVAATLKKQISPKWRVNLMESYDAWSYQNQLMGTQTNAPLPVWSGEKEFFSRAIFTVSPTSAHALAFGAEFSHESFHDPFFSYALDRAPIVTERKWDTDTISFLAEYQWKLSSKWVAFASARTDKHTYSDWLFAPRGTLVFTPNDKDTLKLMAGKSVRRGCDEELWAEHVRKGTIPTPESLLSYEIAYDRQLGSGWRVGASAFYEDYDAIGWVPALYQSSAIGRYKIAGGDFQLTYTSGGTRVVFSEGLGKLVDSSIPASLPAAGQAITAQPYGYGDDLAEWAPFITKLSILHDVGRKLTLSAALIHYSGFPGGQDFADYAATFAAAPSAMPSSDPGYTEPYGPNLFVHAGIEFHATEGLTLQANGYNLAALADETLSKRNFYFRLSEFNVQPASVTLSARYRF